MPRGKEKKDSFGSSKPAYCKQQPRQEAVKLMREEREEKERDAISNNPGTADFNASYP